MTYTEALLKAAKKMELLNYEGEEEHNWDHKFQFVDGKAIIYYIARDPSQCHSGYFGDVPYIKCLMRSKTIHGNPMFDESSLTDKGRLLIEANGDQTAYEKLLIDHSMHDVM